MLLKRSGRNFSRFGPSSPPVTLYFPLHFSLLKTVIVSCRNFSSLLVESGSVHPHPAKSTDLPAFVSIFVWGAFGKHKGLVNLVNLISVSVCIKPMSK